MIVIATNMLRDNKFGMLFRVCSSAVLSIFDAVTDIYVVIQYRQSAELYGRANALMAMLATNITIQVLFAYGQYSKKSWGGRFREMLYSLLFLRPAIDAYRVSTNHIPKEVLMDPLTELMFNKASELAMEAIPGGVLQIYVLLTNPEQAGTFELLSIFTSALTTGFSSAMISFDFDISVHHRKTQPDFYGYIPGENRLRSRCFMLMVGISTLHNLSRSLGVALLASRSGWLAAYFVGCEMLVYLVYKLLRRDLYYWVRTSQSLAIPLAFSNRIVAKTIVDFSGCIQFRHPKELGGAAFCVSMLWAQVMPFVSLSLLEGDNGVKDTKEIVTIFLACSFCLWCTTSAVFFCTISRSYAHTFYDTKTGPQYVRDNFLKGTEDRQKFHAIFKNRLSYTKPIHNEVKEWVDANVDSWEVEKPHWYKVSMVPDDFLPSRVLEAEGGTKRRHRHSYSLRESMREIVGQDESNKVHPKQ